MDNDDLFDIIEPAENQDNTANDPESDFVQGENFVNSLDFVNGFSDANDEEIEKILNDANDIIADNFEPNSDDGLVDDASDLKMLDDDGLVDGDISEAQGTENQIEGISSQDDSDADIMSPNQDDPEVSRNGINEDNQSDLVYFESDNQDAGQTSEDNNDTEDDEISDDDYLDDEDYEQTMVITEGTVITGSINTDCSMDIYGTVNGDVFCEGKLSISGKVIGNSHATEVMINAHRVEGNIECQGVVKVGQNSVIIGDITAGAAVIAGAVKGTLDVQGPVILDSTAVIKGNIKAKSVQLINGAVLEGFCSLEYANSNVDEIFN